MYNFSFPTRISFGAGVIAQLPHYLRGQKLIRPLVVTDPMVSELPFFKRALNGLILAGLSPLVFKDLSKNPVKNDVLLGNQAYGDGCDCILGFGGGAALDVARAIALSVNNRRDLFDYDDLTGGSQLIEGTIPHFVTIPTTSGTGSEVGRSAIISEDDSKRKRILFHPSLMANQVFADPELTYSLPESITAATGMDALTHHMEAFLAKGYNPMCDGIALEGIRMIWENLEKAVKQPDAASRSEMMMASMMGAVAFQKGLGIVHALSHPMSTLLDTHHGLANAINLPYGMAYNLEEVPERFDRLAMAMRLKKGDQVPGVLMDLNAKLSIPSKLSACGVTETHLPDLVELATADFCLPLNPRKASSSQLMEIYQEAL